MPSLCPLSWTKERRVLLVKSFEKKKWVVVRPLPFSRTYPQQYDVSPSHTLHSSAPLHLCHMPSTADSVFALGDRRCRKSPYPWVSLFCSCLCVFGSVFMLTLSTVLTNTVIVELPYSSYKKKLFLRRFKTLNIFDRTLTGSHDTVNHGHRHKQQQHKGHFHNLEG